MFKNHCCCGAITLEVNADIDASNVSPHALAEGHDSEFRMQVPAEDVVVDAEPCALGCLEIFPGHRQYFCNICASTLYTRIDEGQLSLSVQFSGHDVMSKHHVAQCRVTESGISTRPAT
ncbi:hypothetical protein [Alteromonas halophila]|uniref:ADP-ribosylglycohydrolase n=1 Tax=Alteromonas halophila TaxID=516698 RepID=A0A918MZT7_9ALTE|nr:hypothetical protein [Alteromonas halophila]GGW94339.1 hypothetical protein GCM10007391_30820 [Alteromonas halophila]